MMMVAGIFNSEAANAIPCAWLPDENATTPARRWASSNFDSALKAPRNLKAPMRCRFSHLKKTSAASSASIVRERITGVGCACPAMRFAAADTSSKVGNSGVVMRRHHKSRQSQFLVFEKRRFEVPENHQ